MVAAAWRKLDGWLETNGLRIPGLGAPATKAALGKALDLPPSLRVLYAAHDGGEEAEVLGLGRIVWWPLADVLAADPEEREGRQLVVFAAPLDESFDELYAPGELPALDDDLDRLFAVALDTEEIVELGRRGALGVVAEDLGATLGAVVTALETGKKTLDENGRLRDAVNDGAPQGGAETPPTSAIDEIAAALVERRVVELRDGASAKELAAALAEAAGIANAKARARAILAVFESALVEEVFLDDDELGDIARQLARELG